MNIFCMENWMSAGLKLVWYNFPNFFQKEDGPWTYIFILSSGHIGVVLNKDGLERGVGSWLNGADGEI